MQSFQVFPAFDKEMRGKLRGKLCVILGKSGVKKSLFAQNIVYQNIFDHQARCIYSTMEMSASQLNSRFIDMHYTDASCNGSYLLERFERERPGMAREFIERHLAPVFSDKLLITQNTGLQVVDYDLMLEKASVQYGPVDILVPDGLSMMGGDGTETELVNRHTKELKQLAIKWNIFIPLIVHVTKEAERDTRDLSSYARGSEKIMDNCDFYVSLSLSRDSFSKDEIFQKDIGYARLTNKRGSGNTIDVVYDFDDKRLLMTEQQHT